MRHFAAAMIAALLVAGCATSPYQDPYGPGYPGDGYPPTGYPPVGYPDQDPYPNPGPYPPPGAYPQPGPQQPPEPTCPIVSSRDWTAHINAMPGPNAQPKLIVSGTVVMPTGGYQLAFEPYLQIRESYPAQAFATLRATPPSGGATQALTTHDVRWEWPLNQQVGSLEIRCGSQTLASISPLQRAY